MNLHDIQAQLKAPKNQFNSFGKYNYRNCEDILEALKPIVNTAGLSVVLTDEMVAVGGRVYVKATAKLVSETATVAEANGWAREAENKKGMDDAQVTGAASSYARKYALNGLFAIDDTKDADSSDNSEKKPTPPPAKTEPTINESQVADLESLASDIGINIPQFCKWFGVNKLSDIYAANHTSAVEGMEKKRGAA